MAKEGDTSTEMRVCAVPGIYPCAGCDGREDPTFGTDIEPGNGICIGSDCADVNMWAEAAQANEATHKVIVPGAGNDPLSSEEIRAFLQKPIPPGAIAGCTAGAVPLEPEKTEEEKAAEAAELARLTEQLAQRGAVQRQRAAQQSEENLLRAIQNDEAWLDNRTGDYYYNEEDAVQGALQAIGQSNPNLSSYEAVQLVSLLGPGGRRVGVPAPIPTRVPAQQATTPGVKVKTKTKRKTKSRETEFEVVNPSDDEIIAVYKTRRGAENRAAKNSDLGHFVREVPIREREPSRKTPSARSTEFEVFDPESGDVIGVYKTRRGAQLRSRRNIERGIPPLILYNIREITARTSTTSRRRKTKSKSVRRKSKSKTRRKKSKSVRRKSKSKPRRRKSKSVRRKSKSKTRRKKSKSVRRKSKSKPRRRKSKSVRRKSKSVRRKSKSVRRKSKSVRRKSKSKPRRRKSKSKPRRRNYY